MNRIVPRLGWIIGIALSVTPLLLWLPREPLSYYTADPIQIFGTLAKIGSLTGTSMFAFSLLLSARLKWVEWLFNGLDKLYKAHRFFGTYGFFLIMAHPLFLSLEYAQGFRGGLTELWLDPRLSLQTGRIAFLFMTLIIIVTVLMRVKHQTFIKVHRLLGAFFILGVAHAFAVKAQLAVNPGLRAYTIVLWGIGTAAYLYHSIFGAFFITRYRYRVIQVKPYAGGVTEIVLTPIWRPITFTPGQFAFVSLRDKHVDKEAHPYGFTSDYRNRDVHFAVKNLGDYTANLSKVDVGAEAYIEGPYGSFSYLNIKNRRQIWIAGGIGITPFLSMVRSLPQRSRHRIDLYYCTKVKSEAIFAYELQKIARNRKQLRLFNICESTDGFLTADTIAKNSADLVKKDFLLCGPPVMMQALKQQLEAQGVDENQIHFEEFSF